MQGCLVSFLKNLTTTQQTGIQQSGGMKAGCQRGKVTKAGEVSKIHCCLGPSGLFHLGHRWRAGTLSLEDMGH